MARADRLTTTVSAKGQVILASAIRQKLEWGAARPSLVASVKLRLLRPVPIDEILLSMRSWEAKETSAGRGLKTSSFSSIPLGNQT